MSDGQQLIILNQIKSTQSPLRMTTTGPHKRLINNRKINTRHCNNWRACAVILRIQSNNFTS